jgi:hypothetical protein
MASEIETVEFVIDGTSMDLAGLFHGMFVDVLPANTANHGDVVVVRQADTTLTVKRLVQRRAFKEFSGVWLVPESSDPVFQPRPIWRDEFIVGVVIDLPARYGHLLEPPTIKRAAILPLPALPWLPPPPAPPVQPFSFTQLELTPRPAPPPPPPAKPILTSRPVVAPRPAPPPIVRPAPPFVPTDDLPYRYASTDQTRPWYLRPAGGTYAPWRPSAHMQFPQSMMNACSQLDFIGPRINVNQDDMGGRGIRRGDEVTLGYFNQYRERWADGVVVLVDLSAHGMGSRLAQLIGDGNRIWAMACPDFPREREPAYEVEPCDVIGFVKATRRPS